MDLSLVVSLILNDLENRGVIKSKDTNTVRDNIIYAISAGYDYGRTVTKARRQVAKMDKYGNVIATYLSSADAGRKNRVRGKHIAKACRGEQIKAYGFYWKYLTS